MATKAEKNRNRLVEGIMPDDVFVVISSVVRSLFLFMLSVSVAIYKYYDISEQDYPIFTLI